MDEILIQDSDSASIKNWKLFYKIRNAFVFAKIVMD